MSARRSLRPMLLVSALVAALVLLAVLQYRWSGQVSEAERLRMQSSLQLAVDQFRREFARDLLSVGTGLQADPDTGAAQDWHSLAQAQGEWLAGTASGALVSGVYLWEARDGGKLFHLNTRQADYLLTEAPPQIAAVITRLTASQEEHRPGPPRSFAWALDGAAPALIHGVMPSAPRQESRDGSPSERRLAYQIVLLNREAISRKFLPEMAMRHFGSSEGFLYQVQVYAPVAAQSLSGVSAPPLYNSSGAGFLKVSEADLDEDLIEFRPFRGGPDRGGLDRGGRDRPRGLFRGWSRREPHEGPPDMQRIFASPMLVSDGVAPWRIAVRHRAGSVAAAVETLRWRNLGVTFAILLVLGAGMLTIVRNTQRAQRLAELQMDFVAGVSHELRTPLAVISSAAENLTDGVVQGEPQVRQYGSLIRNESRRLAGMMEQILQFAAGQKRQPYKPVPVGVASLIEAAVSLSQTTLTEGGFTLVQHIEPNLPRVCGEIGALTQCLQNLISNAAKYSGDSRWIAVRAAQEANSVSVVVEDRGIGIESSDLPHLFDAFFRARTVRSAQIHGTGLGLNLARGFARDAGGDITVESTAGQGTRFTLRLPAMAEITAEPAQLANRTA